MRIREIALKKPLKPLTPAQARIYTLKQNIQRGKSQLDAERERQHQQRNNLRKLKNAQRK